MRTSKLEIPFDIMKDVRYKCVFVAGNMAVERSFKRGLGVRAKKADMFTLEEEVMLLNSKAADITTLHG